MARAPARLPSMLETATEFAASCIPAYSGGLGFCDATLIIAAAAREDKTSDERHRRLGAYVIRLVQGRLGARGTAFEALRGVRRLARISRTSSEIESPGDEVTAASLSAEIASISNTRRSSAASQLS